MGDSSKALSTRETLIETTMRRLWEADECEVRILDLCQETNLSTSVIYGHFKSRQGLIDESLLRILATVTGELHRYLVTAVNEARVADSFADTLYDLLMDPVNRAGVTRQRQMFYRVSATALARPSIRPAFRLIYNEYIERVDAIYEDLIVRGLLSDHLTARQWSLFFEGQMLSRAFHGLTTGDEDAGNWRRAARVLLDASTTERAS